MGSLSSTHGSLVSFSPHRPSIGWRLSVWFGLCWIARDIDCICHLLILAADQQRVDPFDLFAIYNLQFTGSAQALLWEFWFLALHWPTVDFGYNSIFLALHWPTVEFLIFSGSALADSGLQLLLLRWALHRNLSFLNLDSIDRVYCFLFTGFFQVSGFCK